MRITQIEVIPVMFAKDIVPNANAAMKELCTKLKGCVIDDVHIGTDATTDPTVIRYSYDEPVDGEEPVDANQKSLMDALDSNQRALRMIPKSLEDLARTISHLR